MKYTYLESASSVFLDGFNMSFICAAMENKFLTMAVVDLESPSTKLSSSLTATADALLIATAADALLLLLLFSFESSDLM